MLAAKFILSLFIARFMGLNALGLYGLVTGASAVGQVAMRLGIFSVLSRQAVNQPLHELTHHLRHYGTGCIALYLCLTPCAAAAGWHYGTPGFALLALAVVFTEHACYDVFVLTNNLNRPKLANALMSVQAAGWIYLFMLLAYIFPPLRTLDAVLAFWIAGGFVTLAAASFLTRNWPWKEAFAVPLEKSWYWRHFQKSRHLYCSEVVNMAAQYMDRYLITFFLGLGLAGVYVLFSQVVNAICNLVGAGVLQVFRPHLIEAFRDRDDKRYRDVLASCGMRAMALAAGLALLSGIVVPFLIGYTKQKLATDYLPLLWLMLFAMLFRIADDLAGTALYTQHKDRLTLKTVILKFILACGVGVTALKAAGIYGAAVTVVIVSIASIFLTRLKWNDPNSAAVIV
jgi:O-antigen/teichoic acid export membrane protein